MPTYVYRCKACAHEFEEIQRMADDTLLRCPSCKNDALSRVIGGAGLVFKGSGFYQTDYKKSSPGTDQGSPPKVAETKKDATPDTKTSSSQPSPSTEKPSKP